MQRRIGADLALAQASLAALILGQPFVAAEVVFIALLGEVLEAWTFSRARRAMGRLVEQTPRTARVRRDGQELEIPAHQVAVGDRVIVRPGERVPVDGSVVTGRSTVDQSALYRRVAADRQGAGRPGLYRHDEPVWRDRGRHRKGRRPYDLRPGDQAGFSGTPAQGAGGEDWPTAWPGTSCRWSRWLRSRRSLIGYLAGWPDVWSRVVAVLVVACPCGLVLATPAAMLASMAWLARHGVLIKGGIGRREPGEMRHVRFRQDGNADQGSASVHQSGRDRGPLRRRGLASGGIRRGREPPSAGAGRDRGGSSPVVAARRGPRRHPPARCGRPGRVHSPRRGRPPPGHGRQPAFARGIRRLRSIRPPRQSWPSLTCAARPRSSSRSTAKSRA